MKKITLVIIAVIVLYILAGTFYHVRAVKCYKIKEAQGLTDGSGSPDNAVGYIFNVTSWPMYLFGDAVNKVGVFDCNQTSLPADYGETRTYEFEGEMETIEAVKVLTPTGGEKIKQESSYDIRWKLSINENLTIALCPKDGFCKIIGSEVPNTGSYSWNVGNEPKGIYEIQVYPSGGRERVGRSGEFTIND
jgi:hypothetical protein